jgi:Icc-related predicted phosphoesterase
LKNRRNCKGLKLFGYGGSHKAFLEINDEFIEEVYEPFPYIDEDDFGSDLTILFEIMKTSYSENQDFQAIFLTHIGPYFSKSSMYNKSTDEKKEIVYTGSKTLQNIIEENQEMLL